VAAPTAFWQERTGTRCVVHGDDFTFVGYPEALKEIRRKMEEWYEIKVRGWLDGKGGGDEEVTLLNRVIRWKNGVLEYEADEKHRAVIMKELGLEDESNSVVSPIVKVDGRDDHDEGDDHDDEPLSREEQRQFRALAARANYLAQDRPDLQYAVKEVCRSMAKPTVKGVEALKRIGRYLVGVPTLTWHFVEGVETPEAIDVDSDWAGCRVSRRSTSGGVASVWGLRFKVLE
jgi:hypothetical protein